ASAISPPSPSSATTFPLQETSILPMTSTGGSRPRKPNEFTHGARPTPRAGRRRIAAGPGAAAPSADARRNGAPRRHLGRAGALARRGTRVPLSVPGRRAAERAPLRKRARNRQPRGPRARRAARSTRSGRTEPATPFGRARGDPDRAHAAHRPRADSPYGERRQEDPERCDSPAAVAGRRSRLERPIGRA